MKVTIYDGIWRSCTWYIEVNKLTLNEVINHMQKWFDFHEPPIAWCANNDIMRGGHSVPHNRELVHKLQFKESKYDERRPLIIFDEYWKPSYHIQRYWELGLLENSRITPLWCDKKGDLQKIDFNYRLIGSLVNFETTDYPYQFTYQGRTYSYVRKNEMQLLKKEFYL